MRSSRLLLVAAAACFALTAADPLTSSGADSRDLQERIERTKARIGQKKGTEGVLTGQVQRYSTKIRRLGARIDVLRDRRTAVQTDLDAATGELERVQTELRAQRARLIRLKLRLRETRAVLARRLVERYQADKPDLIGVVLNSHGFVDLIERTEFLRRIGRQDNRIIANVRDARIDARSSAARLSVLQVKAKRVADRIQARRDEIAAVQRGLQDVQDGYRESKDGKAALLADVRSSRHELEGDLSDMREEQARIAGTLRNAGGALPAGAVKRGSGSLIWPVNGPITSPYCESRAWERCHPGIDIGVPAGTPIRAAAAGRVALAAPTQGYGNYTCIQHTSVMSTCYAHQSAYRVSAGESVTQGQVIGLVGCTGLCFGDHLHFEVRLNGTVTSPMDYL